MPESFFLNRKSEIRAFNGDHSANQIQITSADVVLISSDDNGNGNYYDGDDDDDNDDDDGYDGNCNDDDDDNDDTSITLTSFRYEKKRCSIF